MLTVIHGWIVPRCAVHAVVQQQLARPAAVNPCTSLTLTAFATAPAVRNTLGDFPRGGR